MASGDKVSADGFDLPGVPWVSFITDDGMAFHGTYWHNNFGKARSHGCVNVPTPAAKWIYLWSLPSMPAGEVYLYNPPGTAVEVI
jgi:lipoprotein-anchoring transpeptidase ErfK/SrfK